MAAHKSIYLRTLPELATPPSAIRASITLWEKDQKFGHTSTSQTRVRSTPQLPFFEQCPRERKIGQTSSPREGCTKKGGCVVFYLALVLGMLNTLIGARVEVQVSQCWHWEAAHSAFSSHLNAFRLQLLHLSLFCIPSQKCLQHPTDGLANIVFHASCI